MKEGIDATRPYESIDGLAALALMVMVSRSSYAYLCGRRGREGKKPETAREVGGVCVASGGGANWADETVGTAGTARLVLLYFQFACSAQVKVGFPLSRLLICRPFAQAERETRQVVHRGWSLSTSASSAQASSLLLRRLTLGSARQARDTSRGIGQSRSSHAERARHCKEPNG